MNRNARIYDRPVHAMLSLIYIVLLFPLGRLFSGLCVETRDSVIVSGGHGNCACLRGRERTTTFIAFTALQLQFLFAVQVHDLFGSSCQNKLKVEICNWQPTLGLYNRLKWPTFVIA